MADWNLVSEIDDLRATIEQQAASLAAKDKEIERLRAAVEQLNAADRDHLSAKNGMEKRLTARAEQAERALAALAPVRDMLILCDELGGIQPGEGMSGYLRRLIDGVIDGQRALAEAVAWHTIDSAPRDGSAFLAWQDDDRGPFKCWWYENWPSDEAYWMDQADSEPQPTHWKPLPAKPARAFVAQHGSDSREGK